MSRAASIGVASCATHSPTCASIVRAEYTSRVRIACLSPPLHATATSGVVRSRPVSNAALSVLLAPNTIWTVSPKWHVPAAFIISTHTGFGIWCHTRSYLTWRVFRAFRVARGSTIMTVPSILSVARFTITATILGVRCGPISNGANRMAHAL